MPPESWLSPFANRYAAKQAQTSLADVSHFRSRLIIAHAEAALMIREEIEDPNADRVRKRLAEWRGQ